MLVLFPNLSKLGHCALYKYASWHWGMLISGGVDDTNVQAAMGRSRFRVQGAGKHGVGVRVEQEGQVLSNEKL